MQKREIQSNVNKGQKEMKALTSLVYISRRHIYIIKNRNMMKNDTYYKYIILYY